MNNKDIETPYKHYIEFTEYWIYWIC